MFDEISAEGGCSCRTVRYRLTVAPIFVNCCHCSWCQRETGSAFVLNAMVETARVVLLAGAPISIDTPSASGRGQKIVRCPQCHVALWSHYSSAGQGIAFLRVGTLDAPGQFPPDIHIYTSTKLPWVMLPPGAKAVPEFYSRAEVWTVEARERWKAMMEKSQKE